jgi:hypothetical protein
MRPVYLEDQMKNLAFVVVALGMVACNNNNRNTVMIDTGIITGQDAYVSPGMDAGPHDAAQVTGGCTLAIATGNFGSLSAGCFTRCASATITALNACAQGDTACENAAFASDHTPTIAWTINGMAATMPLDCQGCYQLQVFHCASANGCASQVDALLTCQNQTGTPDCTAQGNALDSCITTNTSAVNTCAQSTTMGVAACIGA